MSKKDIALSRVSHVPVLIKEVLTHLMPQDGKVYVDGTFGCGGYSQAILEKADCFVIGIDQDENAKFYATQLEGKYRNRFRFIQGNFRDLKRILEKEKISLVDGIVLDLGVSSPQLDRGERGFSFNKEGPLDMRMGSEGLTAEETLKTASKEKLADIFFYLGEERKARAIARAIVEKREKEGPLKTTTEFADLVRRIVKGDSKIDPATRAFQALRIYVNDELGALYTVLSAIPYLLETEGRAVIVTFHSLEDRLVKNFFKQITSYTQDGAPYFTLLTPKPVGPSREEVITNPRARSAKLRAIKHTDIKISLDFFEELQNKQTAEG